MIKEKALSAIQRRKAYLYKVTRPGYIPDLTLNGEDVNANPEAMQEILNLQCLNIIFPTKK
jgi:hypothetical protein